MRAVHHAVRAVRAPFSMVVRNLFTFFQGFARDTLGCALPSCTMPEGLVHENYFPMEVAEGLKYSFHICSVPVAFSGVQTRVLVDAPGKSSGK